MYLILAGRVRIHRTTEQGEQVELDVLAHPAIRKLD